MVRPSIRRHGTVLSGVVACLFWTCISVNGGTGAIGKCSEIRAWQDPYLLSLYRIRRRHDHYYGSHVDWNGSNSLMEQKAEVYQLSATRFSVHNTHGVLEHISIATAFNFTFFHLLHPEIHTK